MSDTTLRTSLKNLLLSVTGIGVVNDYERLGSDAVLAAAFTDIGTGLLFGWAITRDGIPKIERVSTKVKATHSYVLKGYYEVNDSTASEKLMQAVVDAVVQKFIDAPIANTEGHPLPTVPDFEPSTFAGALCHYAEIRIELAEIVDPTAVSDQALLTVLLTEYLKPGSELGTWHKSTAYALNAYVVPSAPNGHQYKCTVAGTSHASTEPVWPTGAGATVVDGAITWTEAGAVQTDRAQITIPQ